VALPRNAFFEHSGAALRCDALRCVCGVRRAADPFIVIHPRGTRRYRDGDAARLGWTICTIYRPGERGGGEIRVRFGRDG
jgi:hypothetical protein